MVASKTGQRVQSAGMYMGRDRRGCGMGGCCCYRSGDRRMGTDTGVNRNRRSSWGVATLICGLSMRGRCTTEDSAGCRASAGGLSRAVLCRRGCR